jgi:hypothetical protein
MLVTLARNANVSLKETYDVIQSLVPSNSQTVQTAKKPLLSHHLQKTENVAEVMSVVNVTVKVPEPTKTSSKLTTVKLSTYSRLTDVNTGSLMMLATWTLKLLLIFKKKSKVSLSKITLMDTSTF